MAKTKSKVSPDITNGIRKEIETALYRQSQPIIEPPAVLGAIAKLLLKKTTIAKWLGVSPVSVQYMYRGKMRVPARLMPRLYDLLRHVTAETKRLIRLAEQGAVQYGGSPFPPSAIDYFNARIREAEEILKREKGQ